MCELREEGGGSWVYAVCGERVDDVEGGGGGCGCGIDALLGEMSEGMGGGEVDCCEARRKERR